MRKKLSNETYSKVLQAHMMNASPKKYFWERRRNRWTRVLVYAGLTILAVEAVMQVCLLIWN